MVDRIRGLCERKGTNLAALEKTLGFANGSLAKSDCKIQSIRLKSIANYFGVSMEYLLTGKNETVPALSFEEESIISAYRLLDDGQKDLVCKMLGIKRDSLLSKEVRSNNQVV